MKMPSLLSKKQPKQKLRATAARRSAASSRDVEEYDEPSMKFSSAFIIVVLLHLVAVGGIFAFESIKVKQEETVLETPKETVHTPLKAAPETAAAMQPAASRKPAPAPARTVDDAPPAASAKTADASPKAEGGPRDSGKIHTVVKGENPHSIARKLGVSYEALMTLNKIDDPRRLQIGQKLHIPLE